MATLSSVLVWKIPRTGDPGRLWLIGLQREEHDWSNKHACMEISIFHINCETVHLFQFLRKKKMPIISISAITALLYSMNPPSLLKPKKDTGPNRRTQEGTEGPRREKRLNYWLSQGLLTCSEPESHEKVCKYSVFNTFIFFHEFPLLRGGKHTVGGTRHLD